MMHISSATAAAPSPGAAAARRSPFEGERGTKILNAMAEKLGMTAENLKAELQSGKHPGEIAESKGITGEELFAAVRQAVGEEAAPARGHGGPHGPGGPPPPPRVTEEEKEAVLDAITSTLGISAEDLAARLQSGDTLADLLSEKGVSYEQLESAVTTALEGAAYGAEGARATATGAATFTAVA